MINVFNFLICLFVFLCIGFSYKAINKSLLISPVTINVLTIIVSLYTVIELFNLGNIPTEEFFTIILIFFIFVMAVIIAPFTVSKNFLEIRNFINIRKFDVKVADWIFFLNVITSLIYISILWSFYTSGDDRLLLNRDLRSLSIINNLLSGLAIVSVSLLYASKKNKRYFNYFIVILALSVFKGSKSESIYYVFVFIFFYLQFNLVSLKQKIIGSLIIIISVFLPAQLMYGNAFNEVLFRASMSGDVYLLSFVIGDYSKLIGFYDPIKYIFHPLTSLVGFRGYEYPFGAELFGTTGANVTGVGPNDQLPMLALVFFDKQIIPTLLFSISFAFVYIINFKLSFCILRQTKVHVFYRIFVFFTMYTSGFAIFIGVGFFMFNIVTLILATAFYVLVILLKNSTLKFKNSEF